MNRFYQCSERSSISPSFYSKTLLVIGLVFSLALDSFGQCNPNCQDTVFYSLNYPCSSQIDENDLMLDANDCAGPFTVEITDEQNNMYGNTVTADMIGGEFIYTVTADDPGSCTGILIVEDNEAPIFMCPQDVTLNCTTPIDSVPQLQLTDVSDCSDVTISFNDVEDDNFDCQDSETLVVSREYSVVDEYGNENSNCIQTITFVRPSLTSVVFPADMIEDDGLLCPNPDTSINNTGRPTIDDIPLENSSSCDIVTTYSNAFAPTCDGGYLLIRTWTVTNNCTEESVSDDQFIEVIDTVGPMVIPPADFTVDANEEGCMADVVIPPAMITDDCSSMINTTTQGSFGTINGNGGTVEDLEPGEYLVTFTATDDCDNQTTAQMTFTVADLSAPDVHCDQHRIVAINNLGYGEIQAESFDAGSMDICGDVYFKAKRMTIPDHDCTTDDNPDYLFDDDLRFCCADIENNNIMVIVRVYDQDPGPGPVEDDVLEGRYNECMVEVEVQDQLAPTITCPSDMTIDCHDDYSDLSVYGTAEANDNCGIDVFEEEATIDIDECGTGEINREFTAIDNAGFIRQCDQRIAVENLDPFDGTDPEMLSWPDDVTVEGCSPMTNTDPEETGSPEILDDACALVGSSYKDEIFITVPDACYKILRKWKVIDWCQYDSDADDPYTPENGYWTHTQEIKIIDTQDPIISGVSDTIVDNIDANCNSIDISLPSIITDDCTPQEEMAISYTVDLFSDGIVDRSLVGDNASGNYPNGSHEITFKAEDHCNNESEFTFSLEVRDAKFPIAVVINGLAVDLVNMGNGIGMVELNARDFDAGSYDNCSTNENLQFSFSQDPNDQTEIFDCNDIGNQTIYIYVADEEGNQSKASTYVIIQDNEEFCDPNTTTTVQVTGLIMDQSENTIDFTMVEVSNESMSVETEIEGDGSYAFDGIETGYEYQISPRNNLNPLEGVTTLDLLLIQKHILNIEPLEHPFSIIAADINNSQSISATDLVELQRLLLHQTDEFENNSSWRFLYEGFQFEDPNNPFLQDLQEVYDINYLVENMFVDFVGIKIGDVNNSRDENFNSLVETRSKPVIISSHDILLEKDKDYSVELVIENMDYQGWQLEFMYHEENLSIQSVSLNGTTNFDRQNTHTLGHGLKHLLINWYDGKTKGNYPIILNFKALKDGRLSEFLSLADKYLNPEIYNDRNESFDVELILENRTSNILFELYQNSPNPTTSFTRIPVHVFESGEYQLDILDVTGKSIYTTVNKLNKGYHELEVNLDGQIPGLYLYKLSTDSNFRTKRMIIAQ